ncbi:MAG: glycosyltransferase, partial [Nitrospirae bacterium]|nr:glycosyltransferase [Nitrospirota bacterium]
YLLFLNDDIEAVHSSWLEDMVGLFGKNKIGGVSPKLFYENDTIQYAGMVSGVRGLFGTAFHCQPKDSGFYFNMIQSERNVSILSGACLLMPKTVFNEVGGFDSVNAPIMHSDIDLCFKLLDKGYELVYTPFASMRHIGHLSIGAIGEAERKTRLKKRDKVDLYILKKWGDYVSYDPYYPDNMREFLYHSGRLPYKLIADRQDESLLSAKDILLASHDLSMSGAPILLYDLACYLKNNGYFVTVMSPVNGELADAYKKENIPVMIDSTISDEPHEETMKFMANFDLIIANTLVMWRIILTAKEINVPAVWFIHESHFGLKILRHNKNIIKAFPEADAVLFIGEAAASLYREYNINKNFHILNYAAKGLDADKSEARQNEKLTILHVGSIERRKGQEILIEALSRLPEGYASGIETYLAGRELDKRFSQKIKRMARQIENIHIIGELPHNEIAGLMQKADIFVCASRDEVGPLTVLEAMSAGKAIISTAVGGVPVMIRNREDGIIIPVNDSGALAQAIIYLHDNRHEIKRLGENAKKRFYDNFTIEKMGRDILRRVIDK